MAAERRSSGNKSDAIVFLTLLMESHGVEYVGGSFNARFAKCDAVEATDCMLRWNCSSSRWQCFDRRVTSDDLYAHAVGVDEAKHRLAKPLTSVFDQDASLQQSLLPEAE